MDACIAGLLRYAEDTGLIEADDRLWARNRLLEALQLDGCDPNCAPAELPLADLLRELTEDAVSRGVAQDNSVARDLFDTKLMGVLTPAPHEVRAKFRSLYAVSPEQATDWFYAFSQNTNYIRRDRIARVRSGSTRAPTVRWTSRSTSPSRRRTRAPLRRPSSRRSPAIPSALSAPKTRAMPDG